MPQPAPRRSSPWPWILGGCLLLIIAGIVGAFVLWRVATRKISEAVETNIHDPVAREHIAKRLLRADRLPEGYYPVSGTFELPFLVHVRLSDRAPDARGSVVGYDKRGFVYTEAPWTTSSEKLAEFFEGESDSHIQNVGIDVTRREVLSRGTIDNIRYTVIDGHLSERDFTYDGPITLMLIDCSAKKERTAIWFGSDVGDPEKIRAMMAHFALCKPRS